MESKDQLLEHLDRSDLTIEELIAAANGWLDVLAPKQTRYKVTERPDVRTIRYYTSQRLLPRPISYDGGRARYSGAHLIRLLLIKKLQAEHFTLRKIAAILRDASDDDVLDALLPSRKNDELDVVGEPIITPAPQAEVVAGVEEFRRVRLAPGGTLDVPEDVLQDPTRRQELADALESLAKMLREEGE